MKPRDQKALEEIQKLAEAALVKRRPWEREWQRIADVTLPYNVQIVGRRDFNRAQRLDHEIVNDSPSRDLDDMAAGLMARVTSPGRKWFGMQVTNRGVEETELDSDARSYLDTVSSIIASDLERGGWYAILSMSTYLDMGCFGTAAIFMDEQTDGSVTFEAVPVGRFAIDCDHLGKVNTWVREWSATAQQLCKRFGEKNLNRKVLDCYEKNDTKTEFNVLHAVLPLEKPTPAGHMWSSTWWVVGEKRDVLHEGGYYEFPALVPRWTVRAGDVYGRGPGWKAHGKIRMLQHFTKALLRLLDLKVTPPKWMTNGTKLSHLPGVVTNVAAKSGEEVQMGDVVSVSYQDITVVRETIAELEREIGEVFFASLWRQFMDDDKTGRTATEIDARTQEVALKTGPLLESLNGELLEPCIERRYHMLARRGALPPLPESLSGQEIRIEFISVMHQQQQSATLSGLRSFLADVTGLAQLRPEAIDSLNTDALVAEMARANGVPADSTVSKDELAQVRQHKAQQQQQAMESEQALAFTKGIANVKNADPEKLTGLASALAPAAAAQGGAVGATGA